MQRSQLLVEAIVISKLSLARWSGRLTSIAGRRCHLLARSSSKPDAGPDSCALHKSWVLRRNRSKHVKVQNPVKCWNWPHVCLHAPQSSHSTLPDAKGSLIHDVWQWLTSIVEELCESEDISSPSLQVCHICHQA